MSRRSVEAELVAAYRDLSEAVSDLNQQAAVNFSTLLMILVDKGITDVREAHRYVARATARVDQVLAKLDEEGER